MKETIKQMFPLALTILCVVFGITLFFHGFFNQSHGLFSDMGTISSGITQKNISTHIAEELESHPKEPFPTLVFSKKALYTGVAYPLAELFLLQTSANTLSNINAFPGTALYLIDVASAKGTSVLTTLTSPEIDSLSEIPSSAIYDSNKQLLYFHQCGIYTLYIRLYYNHRPGVLFECQIPIETR